MSRRGAPVHKLTAGGEGEKGPEGNPGLSYYCTMDIRVRLGSGFVRFDPHTAGVAYRLWGVLKNRRTTAAVHVGGAGRFALAHRDAVTASARGTVPEDLGHCDPRVLTARFTMPGV